MHAAVARNACGPEAGRLSLLLVDFWTHPLRGINDKLTSEQHAKLPGDANIIWLSTGVHFDFFIFEAHAARISLCGKHNNTKYRRVLR